MITLYQFDISPFCDKVRRALWLKRLDFRIVEVPPSEAARGRWKEISPTGKFPVLEHDGRRLFDSTDIVHYLDECFPAPRLVPSDPAQRARVHVLEDWADEALYFYEMTMRLTWPENAARWVPILLASEKPLVRRLFSPLLPRAIRRVTDAQGIGRKARDDIERELGRHLDAIVAWLGDGDWLEGETLTLADIAVFVQLYCIQGAITGDEAVAARPALVAWMDRVDAATSPPVADAATPMQAEAGAARGAGIG
ncbi:MAG: glutathione S-transferase family protein [Pseudomonadales bacterium]|jgi:glutathione S-transferase|nr:glutathione S-transferase family protein [Pseudomonadales bacterium]